MWIGHFKVWHENCIYLTNSSKFNVVISMYPLNSYVEGKYRYHTNVNILSGSHDDIKQFITAIKKDKRCLEFKGSGNVYLSYMRMKLSDYHTTNYWKRGMVFWRMGKRNSIRFIQFIQKIFSCRNAFNQRAGLY